MKYIKYFLAITIVIFIASCAEDKGNYKYSELNDITFESINKDKALVRTPGELLKIEGKFSRKLNPSLEGLSYLWIIGNDTVSTNKDLEYTIPTNSHYGKISSKFIVIDNNGMRYFKNFNLNISCPYGYGYYVICNEQNNTSRVYFLPSKSQIEVSNAEEKFISTDMIGDYELGTEAASITGTFGNLDDNDTYGWWLYIGTNSKIIKTSSVTMLPNLIYNSESFSDGKSRDLIKPRLYINRASEIFIESDGKIMSIIEQYIYRPAKHKQEYYWTNATPVERGNSTVAFDKLSGKFFMLTTEVNDPISGIFSDEYAIDKVRPIPNCPNFKNSSIIDIRFGWSVDETVSQFLTVSASDKGIAIDTINYNPDTFETSFGKGIVITHPDISNKAKGVMVGKDKINWYFVINNVVYSSPDLLHKLTKVADLPNNLGETREIKASKDLTHIVITMYNPATGKGSFVRMWISDGKIDIFENVMGEPVSTFMADIALY